MGTLNWSDDWRSYALGPLAGSPWLTSSQPSLVDSGRDGKRSVTWNSNGMYRPGGTNHIYGVYRVDDGGSVLTPFNTVQGFLSDILTCSNWILGAAWNGWPYCGIVVSNDGAVHVHNGGAFARSPNSQDGSILVSSNAGVIPIGRGWFFIEAIFVWDDTNGRAIVRVNNQTVINYTGNTVYPYPFCELILGIPTPCGFTWPNANQVVIGKAARGAFPFHGWTGSIDFLASFSPASDSDFIGTDLRVDDLIVNGNGPTINSTISGTTPAATNWQSVDDFSANDGAVTTVSFDKDDVPELDEYELASFPYGAATIYGVQVAADLRTSSPGYADIQIGLTDGTNISDSPQRNIRSSIFNRFVAEAPLTPSGGTWDVAAVNSLRARFQRKV